MWSRMKGRMDSVFHRIRIPPENVSLLEAIDPDRFDRVSVTGLPPDACPGTETATEIVWMQPSQAQAEAADGTRNAVRAASAAYRKRFSADTVQGRREFLPCAGFPRPAGLHADAVYRFSGSGGPDLAFTVEHPDVPKQVRGWYVDGPCSFADCGLEEFWHVDAELSGAVRTRIWDMRHDFPRMTDVSDLFPGMRANTVSACVSSWIEGRKKLAALPLPERRGAEPWAEQDMCRDMVRMIRAAMPEGPDGPEM